MVGRDATPNDVGRNPALIRAAQSEYSKMDVLVCGNCWTVCHFIEEFKQHKEKPCKRDPANSDRDTNDTRPKIWAFLLWKAKKLSNAKVSTLSAPVSWALYQNWVKLEPNIRETWIVAGKTILNFTLGSKGDLMEMPIKITKTVVNREDAGKNNKLLGKTQGAMTMKADPDGTDAKNTSAGRKPPVATVVGKQVAPGAQNKPITRLAKRTPTASEDSTEIVEENVEKIVAKRFNPRRSMHEYLVKWENRQHDQNTWELLVHLENVPHLLENFERQLAIQKESRARQLNNGNNGNLKQNSMRKGDGQKNQTNDSKSSLNERPQRSSKTRAMDQVKQWMSGASPTRSSSPPSSADVSFNASDINSNKRKSSDDDLLATTNTMEDLEDDLIPKHTVKRLRNGDALAVEVKTLNKIPKPKVLKVNGSASQMSSETILSGSNTSDVIVTNKENTGIAKKPDDQNTIPALAKKADPVVRILNKNETAVSQSGIVRLPGGAQVKITQPALSPSRNAATPGACNRSTTQQPRNAASTRTASPTIRQLAGGTTIQRRPTVATMEPAGTPRANISATTTASRAGVPARMGKTAVTPEQKILQLSKSGDLKVTKKLMTQEDVQQRQQQMRQPPPASQVQIQKVQQLASPNRNAATMSIGSGVTAVLKERYSPSPDESILCPVTGKLLGPAGEAQQQQEQLQKEQAAAEVLQAAQMMEELQQQQLQQHQQQQQQQQQQLPQQHLNVLLQHDAEQQQQQLQHQQQQQQQQLQELDQSMLLAAGEHQMITNEDGTPLLVTGEDGTVYQVAGKNTQGQTILVTQGPDGEQHYAYVATVDNDENPVMTLHNAMADGVAQLPADQQAVNETLGVTGEGQFLVKTMQEDGTTQVIAMTESEFNQHQALLHQQEQAQLQQLGQPQASTVTVSTNNGHLCIQTVDPDGTETSIPAEVVQADLPSPEGTRRVVLLLQDGTFMMTEIHENEFKTLNVAA